MIDAPFRLLVLMLAGWLNEDCRKRIEFLEEQLLIYQEVYGRPRLNNVQRCRLAVTGKRLGRAVLRELTTIVTPDTIMRWYGELVARKYDGSENRRSGRPRIADRIRSLVVQMAEENESWGYGHIVGELKKLRVVIS